MRVKCGSNLGDWGKSGVMLTNESHMWLNPYEENYIYILPLMIQKFEEWRNEKGRNKHTSIRRSKSRSRRMLTLQIYYLLHKHMYALDAHWIYHPACS